MAMISDFAFAPHDDLSIFPLDDLSIFPPDDLSNFQPADARRSLLFADMAPAGRGAIAAVTPLDDDLQPTGAEFTCELVREAESVVALRHVRPIRSRYLAVRLGPATDALPVLLRLLCCESFGLDYEVLAARINGAATGDA
jgi:hypothetical protein